MTEGDIMKSEVRCVKATHFRLFFEWFKISLFVVGGGYAIISVANDIFGRKFKWLEKDELNENLPIFSSVPGLIAGNSAVYTCLKILGRSGAVVALLGVALPSFVLFLCLSVLFDFVPRENPIISGAFFGLRGALSGVIAGTLWRLVFKSKADISKGVGVVLERQTPIRRMIYTAVFAVAFMFAALFAAESLFLFLGFGCVSIGGGFPLIPFYFRAFVGHQAPFLQLDPADFSNLMALTQMTPGPISVNAATFFGYNLNGVFGAMVATAALLTPPYFILTAVLVQLERWKESRGARFFISMLRPVSILLLLIALKRFCEVSVWSCAKNGEIVFNPLICAITVSVAVLFVKRKFPVMFLVFAGAAVAAIRSAACCFF